MMVGNMAQMTAPARLLLYAALMWCCCCPSICHVLYGSPPEGGLWAAELNVASGQAERGSLHVNVGGKIKGMSFDPIGNQVLYEIARSSGDGGSQLAFGPTCLGGTLLDVIYLVNTTRITTFVYEDCWNCAASAFSLHDGKVYFILTGDYSVPGAKIHKKVEVRSLDSCSKCTYMHQQQVEHHKLFASIVKCSQIEATVYSERFSFDQMTDIVIQSGSSLIISREKENAVFYLQLFISNIIPHAANKYDVQLELYRISANAATRLHKENVDRRFHKIEVHAIASVDYKDGLLCWSDTISMHCAAVTADGELKDKKRVLDVAEGVSSQVCTGGDPENLPMVTGVAISNAAITSRRLYFGCYSQTIGAGGVGVILAQGHDWTNKSVTSLRAPDGRALRAGALLTVDAAATECQPNLRPPVMCYPAKLKKPTPPPTPETEKPSSTAPPDNTEQRTETSEVSGTGSGGAAVRGTGSDGSNSSARPSSVMCCNASLIVVLPLLLLLFLAIPTLF